MTLPRLFVLGDSISMHYGPHLQTMLAGRFAYARKGDPEKAADDIEIPQNANGGDSSDCLAYLEHRRATGGIAADVLLLNCGLHDIKCPPNTRQTQVVPDAYEKNLRAIITLVKAMGPTLVWMRTTPVWEAFHNTPDSEFRRHQDDVDRYNASADKIMAEANVPVIDLHGLTLALGPMESQCPDGRHYIESTRKAQAAHIAGWLLGRHSATPCK